MLSIVSALVFCIARSPFWAHLLLVVCTPALFIRNVWKMHLEWRDSYASNLLCLCLWVLFLLYCKLASVKLHFYCFHHSFHFTRLWKKVLNKEPCADITNSTSIASFSRGWNRTINLLACTCNWVSEEHGKIKNLYFGKPKNSLHLRCWVWRGHIFC